MAMLMLTYNCNRNCPYCFEKDIKDKNYITENLFMKIIKWLIKNKDKSIILCGGEPTLHPKFITLYRFLVRLNFKINIFTNLLFPKKYIEYFDKKNTTLLINIDAQEEYSTEQYELFKKNLYEIYKKGINCTLSYILYKKDQPTKELIKYAKAYNFDIHFSLAKPTWEQKNEFIPTKEVFNYKNDVINLIKECDKNNIKIHFDCEIEKCFFTSKEIKNYNLYNKGLSHRCNSNFIINPDATISACPIYKISKNKTIFEFENIEVAKELIQNDIIKQLKSIPNMEKCYTCQYFLDKSCDGGCNAEKRFLLLNKEYKKIIK